MSDTEVPKPDELRGNEDARRDEPGEDIDAAEDDPEFVRLDQLYQQALQAMEEVEAGLEATPFPDSRSAQMQRQEPEESSDEGMRRRRDEATAVSHSPHRAPTGHQSGWSVSSSPHLSGSPPSGLGSSPVTPRQIIEAALFVGGRPLTSKTLCSLLRNEFDQSFVEGTIDEINTQYARENRPYTIQFGEGGYRMTLRPEFERLQNRVYGLGPKEVKLSQEALEVLALVAYKQPITRQDIEELGKPNAGGLLRQLLRRELIALHRDEDDPQRVTYGTTQRFLDLFGIGRLDELPQPDQLSFK